MQLMREKAFEIRGIEAAAARAARAAEAAADRERVSAISWQGSAGAASYDVWRAREAGRAAGRRSPTRCFGRRRAVSAAVQRRKRGARPVVLLSRCCAE